MQRLQCLRRLAASFEARRGVHTSLRSHLEKTFRSYKSLEQELLNPELSNDQFARLSRERTTMEPFALCYDKIEKLESELKELESIVASHDPDLEELAGSELKEKQELHRILEREMIELSLPTGSVGERDAILELRAGAGGNEAGLFALELFNMYSGMSEIRGWQFESLSVSWNAIGGIREAVCNISGRDSYSSLKSMAQRIQRIPPTEASGRVHTSTASVVVFPKAEPEDVVINPKDIRIDVFRSSGAGGQHVNTTESAVRVTHVPTGLTVNIQNERSQFKNRERALSVLYSQLYQLQIEKAMQEKNASRVSQIGTMERNERIRTYNENQDRVTDHRVNMTIFGFSKVLRGEGLEPVYDALKHQEKEKNLQDFLAEFS